MKRKETSTVTYVMISVVGLLCALLVIQCLLLMLQGSIWSNVVDYSINEISNNHETGSTTTASVAKVPTLDKALYDAKMLALANIPKPVVVSVSSSTQATSSVKNVKKVPPAATTTPSLWPPHTVYPNAGARLPFERIIAYYGNFYSKGMGVLGQYPQDEIVTRLQQVTNEWQMADASTTATPAIDYIAVVAQGTPGADGKYRLRMPADQIQKAIDLAHQVKGITILDVQVGLSDLQTELPFLEQYLSMPDVHLALDPEFSMKTGAAPGKVIGTMGAMDINFAAQYLANIVKKYNLPPKILIVHRFTLPMVTHYKEIKPLPEVQIVMDADGWGQQVLKNKVYQQVITAEPVQFAGIKLFYKNDVRTPGSLLLTPEQVLKLSPRPSFIQYQ